MAATFTRRNPRVSCGANGRLEGPTGPIRGVVRDISRGGSFFLANRLLPVGNTVEMRIDLPGVAPIKATGEIRYHHRYKEGDGMGIRFVRLSGEDLEAFTQFVHARAGA